MWACGRRVCGSGHDGSDLGIVLRDPANSAVDVAGWHDLQEAVQQSGIPNFVDIHVWPHLPASVHDEVERGYVVVQRGDRNAQGELGAGSLSG